MGLQSGPRIREIQREKHKKNKCTIAAMATITIGHGAFENQNYANRAQHLALPLNIVGDAKEKCLTATMSSAFRHNSLSVDCRFSLRAHSPSLGRSGVDVRLRLTSSLLLPTWLLHPECHLFGEIAGAAHGPCQMVALWTLSC